MLLRQPHLLLTCRFGPVQPTPSVSLSARQSKLLQLLHPTLRKSLRSLHSCRYSGHKRRRGCYGEPQQTLSLTTTWCLDKPVGASVNRSRPSSPPSIPSSLFGHTGLTAETRLRLRRLHSSLSHFQHLSILGPIVARALGRRNETGRSIPCSQSVALIYSLPADHKIELRRSLSIGQKKQRDIQSFAFPSLGGRRGRCAREKGVWAGT